MTSANQLSGGHSGSVLSVTITNQGNNSKIISGGEGGEICVWTPDGQLTRKCKIGDDDVTCLCCSRDLPYFVYTSVGNLIHQLDLRHFEKPVETFEFNSDEINQIALHEKEKFLAACDDSGLIKVISLQDKKVFKTLRKHTNICSSVCFRPRRPWDILSGGYDCKLLQWDFSRGRCVCDINMQEMGQQTEDEGTYLINPPFIHSLALSSNGTYLACGTENGVIQVFNTSRRNPEYIRSLRAHTQGVAQVHFSTVTENLLVSGGNDGHIFFWHIKDNDNQHATSNGVTSHQDDAGGAAASTDYETVTSFSVAHGNKINWIASGQTSSNQQYLVVADNSPNLTMHPFPQ